MLPPPPHAIGSPACASVAFDGRTVAWAGERADGASARRFTFDYAAGERVGQEELFENVRVCLLSSHYNVLSTQHQYTQCPC